MIRSYVFSAPDSLADNSSATVIVLVPTGTTPGTTTATAKRYVKQYLTERGRPDLAPLITVMSRQDIPQLSGDFQATVLYTDLEVR